MKKCISCHKDIENKATKCNHCGSYQGVFGQLLDFYPATTLAIALISLTISILTVFFNFYGYSDLKFTLGNNGYYDFNEGKNHYLVFVTNNGNRPAALVNANLILELAATKGSVRAYNTSDLELYDNLSSRFISGGNKIAWHLKFKQNYLNALTWSEVMNYETDIYVKKCGLNLIYEKFNGERDDIYLSLYDEKDDKPDFEKLAASKNKTERMNANIKYTSQYASCKIALLISKPLKDHLKENR